MSSSPVTIVGNLTRDPELEFLAGGTARLEFGVAANHNWRDASGEWQQKTSFFDCVVWRKAAEDAARILEKGLGVVVMGRLEQRSWENDGQKRSKVEVIVDEVAVLTRSIETFERRRGNTDDSAQAKQQAKPAPKKKPVPDSEPF